MEKFIGLDLENIPKCLMNTEKVSYKPIKSYEDNNYKVYKYIDVKDIRDSYELDDDNKPKLVKKGSKDYSKLLEKLEPVLEDYTLTDSDNNEIKVGEKRIYAPNIISVINGEAKELTTGISDKQTEGYMKLTKEMEKETYNKIKKVLKQVKDKNSTCDLDKGC